jgi:hypothetical protein
LGTKPGVLLNKLKLPHPEESGHRHNLLVANFDLPRPSAARRAALAFIVDFSGHEFNQHSQQKGGSSLTDKAHRISACKHARLSVPSVLT